MAKNKEEDVYPPLQVTKKISKQIASLEKEENRQQLIKFLQEKFISSHIETATQTQFVRSKVLEQLTEKINTMSSAELIRLFEVLSESGGVELGILTGNNSKGNGATINILNSSTPNNNQEPSVVAGADYKKGFNLIEGWESVEAFIKEGGDIIEQD